MNINKNILVTGSNRSGSTWVGRVISTNKKVDNIIEPLNFNRIKRYKQVDINYWYPKIIDSSPRSLKKEVKYLIEYYLDINYLSIFIQLLNRYEGHNLYKSFKKRWRRAGKPIKMLKDPTAIFSVPWLVKEFDLIPVIIIRHPAAYVLSIKEKGWWFDFDNLLKQSDFFSGELEHLKREVVNFKENEKERTIIENAALFWKIFYTQVKEYKMNYPNWYFITHEDLSVDPLNEFQNMFSYLGLEFNNDVRNYIKSSTHTLEAGKHIRNSKENAIKWVHKLSDEEKELIFKITSPVAEVFYDKFV